MPCGGPGTGFQGRFLPIADPSEEPSPIATEAVTHIDSGLGLVKIDFNFSIDTPPPIFGGANGTVGGSSV